MDAVVEVVGDAERRSLSRGRRQRHLGHGRRAPSLQVETGMYVKTLTVDLACHASM